MKRISCRILLLFLFTLLFSHNSWAQNKTVTGKVADETGQAVIGASVKVKNSTVGTTTDATGSFSLSVPSSVSQLQITSVGMQPIEVMITDGPLQVSLTRTTSKLDEVVVVGYGTQKRSVLTGAISSVKAKDLENAPNGRVEQALQGRVAGVTIAQNSGQPGSSSTIRVRGVTTFGGGNNPLWVVDGVVIDAGAIGYLNQSDIESIEVLKDAASAAIYGTRAATGVILVTTKKGKAGRMIVSYNGFYGTSAPAKRLDLLNASQYGALLNERSVAGGGSVIFPDLSVLGKGTDWQDAIFNNSAKRFSHEISLSGGSEKSIFYLSANFQEQEGIVATDISNFTRKSLRLNSTHKISSIFTFGQTAGYTYQKGVGLGNTNSEFGGPLSSAINLDPITPLVETDPNIANAAPYSVNPVFRDANNNPYGISKLVGQEMTNPVAYQKTRLGNHNFSHDIVANAFLEATIIKGLKLRSSAGTKLAFWGGVNFTPVSFLSATVRTSQNSYGKSENKTFNWNVENTLTYDTKIKDHHVNLLVGQGAYVEENGGGSGLTAFNLPISSYQDASFNFDIPQASRNSSSYDFTNHKLSSLFSRLNYDYQEKYLFTGIVRRDGSTKFGLNKKYGYFPSFSAGWVAHKESFWPTNNVVNTLKVRGGYGVVGNDNISNFGYVSTVSGGYNYTLGTGGAITTGYAPNSLDNPDLHWEETSQANIGFESRLFSALDVSLDFYKKKTSGILRPITIPGYVGVSSSPVGNIADMDNSGVELELGYRKNFGALQFSANGNIAYLKNEVTYVGPDADFIPGEASFQSMGAVTRIQVGQSYNAFYGYKTAGIFQNMDEINNYKNPSGTGPIQPNARPGDFRWQDTNGDGTITVADKTFLGTNIPKYTYGLTVNLEFKGFDFMMFAQGSAGSKIFQGLRRLDIGNANWQTRALGRWAGEGTSTTYPRLTSNDANGNFSQMSDFYLESGDYARLKILQVGYALPANVISKIRASRIRLYVTAENLLTLTDYTGYDPEIGGGVFGVDKGQYPQARSFIAGVQLQF